jgi:hypothetical protein
MFKLYVKTHSITGIKYIGFTAKQNAHKYTGSGFHWKAHLKVHGNHYTTDIILETTDIQVIRDQGLYYSNLWDVVESAAWANQKPKSGPGVIPTRAMIEKQLATKLLNGTLNANTPASVLKAKLTREKNNTSMSNPIIREKMLATKVKNGTLDSNTLETIAKSKASKAAKGIINGKNPIVECQHCHKVISLGNHNRWHGDNCKTLSV